MLLVHSFYASDCCGGHDCHPVPCDEIHATIGGWQWRDVMFKRSAFRNSPDGECHVCVTEPADPTLLKPTGTCIYLPERVQQWQRSLIASSR